MYVKVHEKDNQWFRDDNGALVGKTFYTAGSEVLIDTKDKSSSIIAYYGYLNKDSSFVPLCKRQDCDYECLCECKPECRYTTKEFESSGFYMPVSD